MSRVKIMRVGALVETTGEVREAGFMRVGGRADPRKLVVEVTAFAESAEGERIMPDRPHTEIGLWRRGRSAIWKRYTGGPLPSDPIEEAAILEQYRLRVQDVEDAVNEMFDRDPEQSHVPRSTGWHQLMIALDKKGIDATIEELKAVPFVCELSPGLMRELGY